MDQIITTTLTANTEIGAKLGLTSRQVEAAAWAAEGKTDPEIGMIIGRTGRTAKAHVLEAMARTDTHTRAQLVAQLFINKVLAGKDVIRMAIFSCVLGATWVTPQAVEASPVDNAPSDQELARRFSRRSRNGRRAKRIGATLGSGLDTMLAQIQVYVTSADDLYTDADLHFSRFHIATNEQEPAL